MADHPLLKLNKRNTLILCIDPQKFNDSDLEVLKKLTAPGRPLKKLLVGPYSKMSYNDKVMDLIRQNTSLEELRISVQSRPKGILPSHIWYFPGNKSLYITCKQDEFAFIVASLPPIKLAYINFLVNTTIGYGTNSTLGENFSTKNNIQFGYISNITIYSKLMLIEPRLLLSSNNSSAAWSSVKNFKMAMNIIEKCYMVSLGNFIYGDISYHFYIY